MIYTSRLLFIFLLLAACEPKIEEPVSITWTNEKATGLVIRSLLASETDILKLEVRLVSEYERSAVLGTFRLAGDAITFTPIVPLTNGLTYELLEDGKEFGEITIPISDASPPEIEAIYPNVDTIPENLLKVHIQFSRAMMEGKSAQFVKLIENGKDTLQGTFLDLQPELWIEAGTTLTLWLDPGRIKLDLIPNKELGNPLTRGRKYTLVILPGWNSKDGLPLQSTKIKSYYVGERDDQSPSVDKWSMDFPAANTREPFTIKFGEPLDQLLAGTCFRLKVPHGSHVPGIYKLNEDVRVFDFTPDRPWEAIVYEMNIEPKLEDLAGNNLYRLFEVDLTKPKVDSTSIVTVISFKVGSKRRNSRTDP